MTVSELIQKLSVMVDNYIIDGDTEIKIQDVITESISDITGFNVYDNGEIELKAYNDSEE